MLLSNIYTLVVLAATAFATIEQPCIGAGGRAGVCLAKAKCTGAGGSAATVGTCANPVAGEVCCTKAVCSNTVFSGGNCRWKSDCKGASPGHGCPGGSQFVCCREKEGQYGPYKQPPPFPKGGCKKQAVDGANRIVKQFPGRIRDIGCYRTDTACRVGYSDHPCGLAVDLMCSDGAGLATNGGTDIATWVMNNAASLRVSYVIWGQRIWSPGKDKVPKPWSKWRTQENRGGITINHWDHVHVSFKP